MPDSEHNRSGPFGGHLRIDGARKQEVQGGKYGVWLHHGSCQHTDTRAQAGLSHEAGVESGSDFAPRQREDPDRSVFPIPSAPLPHSSLASVISTKSKSVNSFTKHSQRVSRGGRTELCRHLALALEALPVSRGGGPCVQTAATQSLTCPGQNLIAFGRRLFTRAVND